MTLSKASNEARIYPVFFDGNYKNTVFLILIKSTISPDRKQTKEPLHFNRKCLKKLLLHWAHDATETQPLSRDGEEENTNTSPNFAATFSVLLTFHIWFRRG